MNKLLKILLSRVNLPTNGDVQEVEFAALIIRVCACRVSIVFSRSSFVLKVFECIEMVNSVYLRSEFNFLNKT
eukprot:snap_masked-scaffold_14-processed-gene-7.30-mRNA-1 protein AED:1.00 eAED:1.00 QI:0/-1/0/0/-1/1/1/0/72